MSGEKKKKNIKRLQAWLDGSLSYVVIPAIGSLWWLELNIRATFWLVVGHRFPVGTKQLALHARSDFKYVALLRKGWGLLLPNPSPQIHIESTIQASKIVVSSVGTTFPRATNSPLFPCQHYLTVASHCKYRNNFGKVNYCWVVAEWHMPSASVSGDRYG